jgi:hypothetical protein
MSNDYSEMPALGRFPQVDVDPQLIIPTGRLVIVDRSCDAFDPVHAASAGNVRKRLNMPNALRSDGPPQPSLMSDSGTF